MDPTDLAEDENWWGGFYELAIEMGHRDDRRLDSAIAACWNAPSLDGCWLHRAPANAQTRVAPSLKSQEGSGHLHGIASIPGFGRVVCGSVVVREEESQIDWLVFYLPIGGLVAADERADSLWDSDSQVPYAWRSPIDDFLVDAARRVQAASEFELGLIGWEVSGEVYRSELGPTPQARRRVLMLLPDEHGELVRLGPAVDPAT